MPPLAPRGAAATPRTLAALPGRWSPGRARRVLEDGQVPLGPIDERSRARLLHLLLERHGPCRDRWPGDHEHGPEIGKAVTDGEDRGEIAHLHHHGPSTGVREGVPELFG